MVGIGRNRGRHRESNLWPGFVDALATLLMVIIFVLMVFAVAQFYLTQMLSGRDVALQQLRQQVAELSELLSLERDGAAELRFNVAQLSAELQASLAQRDTLQSQTGQLLAQRDQLEDRLADSVSARVALQQRLVELQSDSDGQRTRLAEMISERDALLGKLRSIEQETRLSKAQRDELHASLNDALQVIEANQETIELQLKDLERLRRDIDALKTLRSDLEGQVANLLAARALLEETATELIAQVSALNILKDELTGRIEILSSDVDAGSKKIGDLAARLAAEDAKHAALEDTAGALRSTAEAQKVEIEKLLAELAAAWQETATLVDQGSALRGELSNRQDRILELASRLAEGDKQVKELERERDTLTQTTEKSRARIAELLAELAATKLARKDLLKQHDALQQQHAKLRLDDTDRKDVIAKTLAALAGVRDRSKELEARVADETKRTLLAQKEIKERDIRLAELTSQYDLSLTELTEEQKVSTEAAAQVALLNAQLAALRQHLATIEAALEASEVQAKSQNVKILDLGKKLNQALASKVNELQRYRSEFFGRLREALKGRRDIRIVGDRFVFQSEVLFKSGSNKIGEEGRRQLIRLAAALKEIATKIPNEINWILQVEGHTDRVPIFSKVFASNWELSTARATSVVKLLISQGIAPQRLSATGYGQFQPIDNGTDEIGNRRNRRIEFKLTQK